MGVGQGAKLSVPNSQWMTMGKAAKAESGDTVTSQPCRGGKLAQSRGQEKHKGWEGGRGDRPTSQSRASGRCQSWRRGTEGSIQNWITPLCWGRNWQNRVIAEVQNSCCLVKTTIVLTILHKLAVSYLSSQLQLTLWTEGTKYYAQASHLVRPHQSTYL
jgi:hypothetical protein